MIIHDFTQPREALSPERCVVYGGGQTSELNRISGRMEGDTDLGRQPKSSAVDFHCVRLCREAAVRETEATLLCQR